MLKNKDSLQEHQMTKNKGRKSNNILIQKRNKLTNSKECLTKFNPILNKF